MYRFDYIPAVPSDEWPGSFGVIVVYREDDLAGWWYMTEGRLWFCPRLLARQ